MKLNRNQRKQYKQIRILRTAEPFKTILKGWRVHFEVNSRYKAQCFHSEKKRSSRICDWGKKGVPEDYVFHEMLHICLKVLRMKKWRERCELEEKLVSYLSHHICGLGKIKL